MNEFLNPKSMITPGLAGALVMVIGNTLYVSFGLPKTYTFLILCFFLCLTIVAQYSGKLWEKTIYLIINTLFVFSFATGVNTVAPKAAEKLTRSNITFIESAFATGQDQLPVSNGKSPSQSSKPNSETATGTPPSKSMASSPVDKDRHDTLTPKDDRSEDAAPQKRREFFDAVF